MSCASCGSQDHDVSDAEIIRLNIGQKEIAASPQRAARLRLASAHTEDNSTLRLDDGASAARASIYSKRLEFLEALEAIDQSKQSDAQLSVLSSIVHSYQNYADLAAFGHGDIEPDQATPYAVTHITGAYLDIPALIQEFALIKSLVDAQDYINFLVQASSALRDDRTQLETESNAGVTPPAIILQEMITRLENEIQRPAAQTIYLSILTDGLDTLELKDEDTRAALIRQAEEHYRTYILTELSALRDLADDLLETAPLQDGLHSLPHGGDWYETAIKLQIGAASATPDAILPAANTSLEQLDRAIDVALNRSIQEDEPSPPSLVAFLDQAERPAIPETPEMQADLESDLSGLLELVRRRLSFLFDQTPDTTPEIRIDMERRSAFVDSWKSLVREQRSGHIRVNAYKLSQTPGLLLPAQLYYAGYPGAALQDDLLRSADLTITDKLFSSPGFEAGWSFYALGLTREFNAYNDAPSALLGLLLLQRLETASAIADIKMHTEGWSVEDAAAFLVDRTGFDEADMRIAAMHMAAVPGHATAPFAGGEFIETIRTQAEYALGDDFDIKTFHAVVLDRGPRPLDAVSEDIDRWIGATKSANTPIASN